MLLCMDCLFRVELKNGMSVAFVVESMRGAIDVMKY